MIDNMMVNIGAAFMLIGGVMLVTIVLGLAIYAAGVAWIAASNKWRDILRAESLIYEYRMNRKAYIEWRGNANKTRDNAVPVVRCKDCKYYKPDECECGCDFAGGLPYVKAGDFCSYGEGKDGES